MSKTFWDSFFPGGQMVSRHIFFLQFPTRSMLKAQFVNIFSKGNCLNAHVLSRFYIFHSNWFQSTSSILDGSRTLIFKTFFLHVQKDSIFKTKGVLCFPKKLISIHILSLLFPKALILKAHLLYYIQITVFQKKHMSTHIFFLHVTKELTSTHVFYTIFSRKLIFKPHVFYMFQRNWYQRTSSFYIVRRKWFWKHILFLHVPKELISTYIFFLDSLSSTGTKGVAKGTSSILRVSRKLMFTVFYMFKRIFFSTHIFSLHVPNKLVLKARFL